MIVRNPCSGPDPEDEELLAAARSAAQNAYAPYSGFAVGAALRLSDGRIVTGCNVENASYGATICAERNAVAAAVNTGALRFIAIAVSSPNSPPAPPCGVCRQVLAEFNPEITVYMTNPQGERLRASLHELLPLPFTPDRLNGFGIEDS